MLRGLRFRLPWSWNLGIGAAFLCLVALLQWHSGAYHSDFTADEDEPAHAISSLLVHDYLTSGFTQNLLRFARTYYLHYPKVAIGHWPPLFYAGEASWMLLVGRTRAALLSFVGVTAAGLLVAVFTWVRRLYGVPAALLAGLILAAPVFLQVAMESVSPNCLLALLVFSAALCYGRYLATGRRASAVLFAVLTVIALGVHGRGAPLLLLPATAAILRRPAILKTWKVLLVIALFALVLTAPVIAGQADPLSSSVFFDHAKLFLYRIGSTMSWPVALLGMAGCVSIAWNKEQQPEGVALFSLLLSCWVFHSAVNAGWADYYLMSAAPAVAALFGAGFRFCLDKAQVHLPAPLATAMLALLVCVGWLPGLRIVQKQDLGYHRLFEHPSVFDHSSIYLVAGNPLHEGALISEVALRDGDLRHIVLRASKVLAHSLWTGRRYQARFANQQAVAAFLADAHVGVVVMQQVTQPIHMAQLAAAVENTAEWQPVHLPDQPAQTEIFWRIGALPPGPPHIRIPMRDRLGSDLELQN